MARDWTGVTVRKKLLASFVSIAFLVLAIGVASIFYSSRIKADVNHIAESTVHEVKSASEATYHIQKINSFTRELLLEEMKRADRDPELIRLVRGQIDKSFADLTASVQKWEKATQEGSKYAGEKEEEEEEEELQAVRRIQADTKHFVAQAGRVSRLEGGARTAERYFNEEVEPMSWDLVQQVKKWGEEAEEEIQQRVGKVKRRVADITLLSHAATMTAFCFAILLGLFISKRIVGALDELVRGAGQIAHGDFNLRLDIRSKDEFEQLGRAFNAMSEALQLRTERLKRSYEQLQVAEKRMLQSEKMSAVGQLAAGMAHELNNPLGIILGFAQSISQRVKPGDPLEMPVRSIEREVLRCKDLVQDLLTFSRADASAPGLTALDLNETVRDATRLIETGAAMNSVKIELELAAGLPPIAGSQAQIQQVLVRLADNAVDAMPDGGTLRISTEAGGQPPQPSVCLKVSDTGTGIPKEIESRIFEPFFTTKPVGMGAGLGLSLVFEIVKRHSGTIEVESRPGRTEFRVQFPAAAPGSEVAGGHRK